MYLAAVKHFKHSLEEKDFKIFANNKPLIYTLKQKFNRATPKQVRPFPLDYITQFTSTIEHINGWNMR